MMYDGFFYISEYLSKYMLYKKYMYSEVNKYFLKFNYFLIYLFCLCVLQLLAECKQ